MQGNHTNHSEETHFSCRCSISNPYELYSCWFVQHSVTKHSHEWPSETPMESPGNKQSMLSFWSCLWHHLRRWYFAEFSYCDKRCEISATLPCFRSSQLRPQSLNSFSRWHSGMSPDQKRYKSQKKIACLSSPKRRCLKKTLMFICRNIYRLFHHIKFSFLQAQFLGCFCCSSTNPLNSLLILGIINHLGISWQASWSRCYL